MSSGEKREKTAEGPWFLWQWSPTLWKLSLSYSLTTYRDEDATVVIPWTNDRCMERSSFLESCWIIQVRRDLEWLVVQPSAQSKASCEARPGCSRLYPLWSWKTLSFLQNWDCPTSLGQLLSCWTLLFIKMFLLISSLNVPDFHSCLLAFVLFLCTANP